MGWGVWPQPDANGGQADEAPNLIPIQPNGGQAENNQEPVEEVLQVVVEQVATPEQAPQGQVLAMDDIIGSSEDEAPPPPLLA